METREWEVRYKGKRLGDIKIKEAKDGIVLIISIDPDPKIEVRVSASGGGTTEYVFKEKKES